MQKAKRWISWILILVLCTGIIPHHVLEVEAEDTEHYYETQLTESQYKYYLQLEEMFIAADHFPKAFDGDIQITLTGTQVCATEQELHEEAQKQARDANYAYIAFTRDYPQVFWNNGIETSYSYISYGNGTYKLSSLKMSFQDVLGINETKINEYKEGIKAAVEEIREQLPSTPKEYDYYQAIHAWVCEHVSYHYAAVGNSASYPASYTSYPVFAESQDSLVVCEGYGETYKILCDQFRYQDGVDLNCVLITGVGVTEDGSENHLWNAVKMPDSNWYGVDTTWDDQNEMITNYFLCGKKTVGIGGHTFEIDHVADEKVTSIVTVKYPEIATFGYGVRQEFDWNYKDGKLIITGTGALPDYLVAEGAPWYQYRNEIKSVVIDKGIESMPEGLFSNYKYIESLTLPFIGTSKDAEEENAVLGILFGKTSSGVAQYHKVTDGNIYYYQYAIPNTLRKVEITDARTISLGAFHNCVNLKSLIINEGITEIGMYSMANCSSLTEIVIPDSVTYIGEHALAGCTNLQSITLPFVGSNIDSNQTYDAVLGYIFGRAEEGVAQCFFKNGGSMSYCKYQIPTTLKTVRITKDTTIPVGAFSNCESLAKIEFEGNVTTIHEIAFDECVGLKNIRFMGNAPEIQSNAFQGCGVLKAYIPEGDVSWTSAKKVNYSATEIEWESQNIVDLVAKIASAKISLQDKIAVKFLVTLDSSVSDDDYMVININGREEMIKVNETTTINSDLTGETRHIFECDVKSKEMTKLITVKMVVNGQSGSAVTYSVKQYTDMLLGLSDGTYEAEKKMARAMLNYGGYAQLYFLTQVQLQEEVLANKDLYNNENDPVLTMSAVDWSKYEPTGQNQERLEATLLLESETELRFYFEPESGKTINDYIFSIDDTSYTLKTGTAGGRCYVSITGIQATELQNMFTIVIKSKANGSIFASTTYGAFSYVKTIIEEETADEKLENLVRALYLYNQAALEYSK